MQTPCPATCGTYRCEHPKGHIGPHGTRPVVFDWVTPYEGYNTYQTSARPVANTERNN